MRALMLALPAVLLTALSVGLNLLVPAAAVFQQTFLRLLILAVLLFGSWLGLGRAGRSGRPRLLAFAAIVVPLLVWQSVVWWLAATGAFEVRARVPLLPLAILLPVLIGLPILLRSRTIGALLDALPASWLVGMQVYRVFGSVFLVTWAAGNLSTVFALPAGLGDTLVGLLALPVAVQVHAARRSGRTLGLAWNALGMLDLIDAVALGILTTPGPLQLIVPDRVGTLGAYPLVLIPAFAVPLSFMLHAVSLRQLRRRRSAPVTPLLDTLASAPAAV